MQSHSRRTLNTMTTKGAQLGVCNVANRTVFEGDNLDVMRGINDACIDLIYLDPPFNSNRDYAAPIGSQAAGAAFKDTWDLTDVDEAWHNEIAETDLALYKVIDASEYSHGSGMKSYLIMMAVRLLEMRRILKATGSIYVHCDPTASHYLKNLMDAVFGKDNFRSEIVWRRTSAHGRAKRWGNIHDTLLFYSRGKNYTWNRTFQDYNRDYIDRFFRHSDARGLFRLSDLTGPGTRRGNSGLPRRGVDPTAVGRHWEVPPDRTLHADFQHPPGYAQMTVQERLDILDAAGFIYWPARGATPSYKRYVSAALGSPIQDVIWDIPPVGAQAKERTGYPTQKPLALLERIIKASSNEGDVVLDPFCGCATTCIATERLDRQWIGIDLSALAVKLVEQRARNELGLMGGIQSNARTDIPLRTDREPPPPLSESKVVLYGTQGGNCNGCGTHFMPQHLTVDHIIARSKGGTGHLDNLQLLCGHCNSLKGNRPMEYLRARLVRGWV